MRKSKSGFTIVELIIVVIVIAILATIIIVAYKSTQDRAKNSQTVAAANQWAKALEIYKIRNGGLPSISSCLGDNYKYNDNGLGTSGVGQCRQDTSTTGVTSQASFFAAMAPYINSNPTPAMVTARNTSTKWYRGMYYYVAPGNIGQIELVQLPASDGCPDRLGDIPVSTSTVATNGNYICTYPLGSTTSF